MHRMTRIVFMGSPEFAVPSLRALQREYSIVGVVTQPDRPAGRGKQLRSPAIKLEATKLGLPVIQPAKLGDSGSLHQIQDWSPDLIVVAAFGQLLRSDLLRLPPQGCVNVHASLLPRWRGAAPIQAAIAAGDPETGVTIMKMNEGLDTGDIISQRSLPINRSDTGGSLSRKLSELGAELLVETLPQYLTGELRVRPQDSGWATKAPSLRKEDGLLDPSTPAEVLERRVRALNPWPGAYIDAQGRRLKIHEAHVVSEHAAAGTRIVVEGLPGIATIKDALLLDTVQPPGKRTMGGRDFLAGVRDWAS